VEEPKFFCPKSRKLCLKTKLLLDLGGSLSVFDLGTSLSKSSARTHFFFLLGGEIYNSSLISFSTSLDNSSSTLGLGEVKTGTVVVSFVFSLSEKVRFLL